MKVYSGLTFVNGKQRKAIVKAKSQKRAANLVGCSLNHFRNYWSITGNKDQLAAADQWPEETVLIGGDVNDWSVDYKLLEVPHE